MKGYPPYFLGTLMLTVVVVFVTGLLLIPSLFTFRLDIDWFSDFPNSWRTPSATLHTGMSLLFLMLAGALWSIHMRSGWARKLQRVSGGLLVGSLLVLTLSALGIFYFGDEDWSMAASLIHLVLGGVMGLMFVWHWQKGRRLLMAR